MGISRNELGLRVVGKPPAAREHLQANFMLAILAPQQPNPWTNVENTCSEERNLFTIGW